MQHHLLTYNRLISRKYLTTRQHSELDKKNFPWISHFMHNFPKACNIILKYACKRLHFIPVAGWHGPITILSNNYLIHAGPVLKRH